MHTACYPIHIQSFFLCNKAVILLYFEHPSIYVQHAFNKALCGKKVLEKKHVKTVNKKEMSLHSIISEK